MQRESSQEILSFFLLAICAFLWVCLISSAPEDYLAPETGTVRNACGPVGAAISFHFVSWVGKLAAYGLSTLIGLLGLLGLFRRQVEDWGWKVLGIVLMTLALSATEVAAFSNDPDFRTLPGGYYGQFFYDFLLSNLSSFGTYLLLAVVMLVAFVVSTDTLFYPAFERAGGIAFDRERWENAGLAIRDRLGQMEFRGLADRWRKKGKKSTKKKRGKNSKKKSSRTSSTKTKAKKKEAAKKEAAVGDAEDEEEEDDDYEYEYEYVDEDGEEEDDGDVEYEYVDEEEDEEGEEDDAVAVDAAEDQDSSPKSKRAKAGKSAAKKKGSKKTKTGDEEEAHAEDDAAEKERPPLVIHAAEPVKPSRKLQPVKPRHSGPYQLPSLDLVNKVETGEEEINRAHLEKTASKIEETLKHFKIDAHVVQVQKGPTITQYELTLAAGIKVNRIINLADDLAMALKAQSIRIVAPIPGKSTVGIEVPNKKRSAVGLRELLESSEMRDGEHKLPLALGRDIAGAAVIGDLGEMPHLLIAGSTGSGKSVAINSIIISLLMSRTPDEVKLILVDPKMVELAQFENIPHLLAPVVTDMKKAPAVLGWTVDKMEERYELLAAAGVRHISGYNALGREKLLERVRGKVDDAELDDLPDFLPFIVVVIDELADLMMTASKEVEASITRLSQKSRAVGIHVILATQRPSVDVITGLIKANMPARISFHVASRIDSRTILDRNGSEKLLGKGDMLYLPPGTSALRRVQGTFISDKEIRDVVQFAVQQAEPQFSSELTRFGVEGATGAVEEDELFEDAVKIVLGSQRGSVTLLQRQLQIGYTRASRLMEIMHERGLVGPFKGSKAREVYYTLEEWEQANARNARTQDAKNETRATETKDDTVLEVEENDVTEETNTEDDVAESEESGETEMEPEIEPEASATEVEVEDTAEQAAAAEDEEEEEEEEEDDDEMTDELDDEEYEYVYEDEEDEEDGEEEDGDDAEDDEYEYEYVYEDDEDTSDDETGGSKR